MLSPIDVQSTIVPEMPSKWERASNDEISDYIHKTVIGTSVDRRLGLTLLPYLAYQTEFEKLKYYAPNFMLYIVDNVEKIELSFCKDAVWFLKIPKNKDRYTSPAMFNSSAVLFEYKGEEDRFSNLKTGTTFPINSENIIAEFYRTLYPGAPADAVAQLATGSYEMFDRYCKYYNEGVMTQIVRNILSSLHQYDIYKIFYAGIQCLVNKGN